MPASPLLAREVLLELLPTTNGPPWKAKATFPNFEFLAAVVPSGRERLGYVVHQANPARFTGFRDLQDLGSPITEGLDPAVI